MDNAENEAALSGPKPNIPKLVTCSYAAYRRDMGTAVRITLSAPRYIKLPDPRYSKYRYWPYLAELAPRRDYFNAPEAEFDRRYLQQLDQLAADIYRKLTWIEPESGALALLCFEKQISGPHDCHRRLAANWLEERLGVEIREMDAGPGGCT